MKKRSLWLVALVAMIVVCLCDTKAQAKDVFLTANEWSTVELVGGTTETISYKMPKDGYVYFIINPTYYTYDGERKNGSFYIPTELYCDHVLLQKRDVYNSGPYYTTVKYLKKGETIEISSSKDAKSNYVYYYDIKPVVSDRGDGIILKNNVWNECHLYSNNSETYRFVTPKDGYVSCIIQSKKFMTSDGTISSGSWYMPVNIYVDKEKKEHIDAYNSKSYSSNNCYVKKGTVVEFEFTSTESQFRDWYFDFKVVFEADTSALDTPEEPFSLLASTNVVVGRAVPNATVSIKYENKTYKCTADENGIYKVITATLKEGKKVTIQQKSDGRKSKALTTKVKKLK